jgi:integrase
MQNPAYLSLSRHNVFYFRFPLPHTIRQPGKASHLKISLDTRCPKEGLRLARLLEYHAFLIMQTKGIDRMEYGDIINLLKEYFYELINEKKAAIHKHGPLPAKEVDDLIKHVEQANNAIEQGRDDIIPGQSIHALLKPIIQRFDLDMSQDSDDYRILQSRYKYAYKGYAEKILSHNHKQLDFLFTTDPTYLKAVGLKRAKPENRLTTVINQYIAETKHTWGIRAEEERRACFALLIEILGEHYNAPDMDMVTARRVKEILIQLPANRNKMKATRDLPVMEQIRVDGMERLSIASINKYLICFSGMCGWARKNGYINENPFEGMLLKEEQGKKRDMFTVEEARTIITALDERRRADTILEYRYWGAMIALYTGARLNEIASLTPADLVQENGIWYFDINDEEEKKRLKTDAAKRRVPVHSELLAKGLIEYSERVQQMPGNGLRLLYELTYNEKMGWGRKLGDWFNNTLLVSLGLKADGLSFHSLRHNVITSLRRAKVDNHIVRALVGHEPDGVTEEVYNHGFELPVLKESIEQLSYTNS